MNFRILGCHIEYSQAAKRLEALANTVPGTRQAQERQALIRMFKEFHQELFSMQVK